MWGLSCEGKQAWLERSISWFFQPRGWAIEISRDWDSWLPGGGWHKHFQQAQDTLVCHQQPARGRRPPQTAHADLLSSTRTAGRMHTNPPFLSLPEHLDLHPEPLSTCSVRKEFHFLLTYWRGATAAPGHDGHVCLFEKCSLNLFSLPRRGLSSMQSPEYSSEVKGKSLYFLSFPQTGSSLLSQVVINKAPWTTRSQLEGARWVGIIL